ncbi:dihydrolipoyl dehydrogenase [uncultured Prevotella sp.]|uniref:dihydrolipoyl dehydrogenase n=1 Tax=uncultured Prevotella sp. TaxID=159272 RepID=UPI00261BF4C2|nr:dihydrolipoyl dehydrogenase [uncultured Prevotella sp.]
MKTDLIIIGSGPGGYNTACHAAKNGLNTVIFEDRQAGGTCLNRGCIPTKTLCHEADMIEAVAAMTGSRPETDLSKAMNRKEHVTGQLREGVETLMKSPGITFVKEHASFKDAHTVVAGGEEYTADNIIIATGSESKMPPIEGINEEGVVTSTELLNLEKMPNHLCIIGAGVIGMEFASVFKSFGSNVTVIEFLKECLPAIDSDIAKRMRKVMERRGIEFYMQSAVKSINRKGDKLTVCFDKKNKPQEVEADIVLVATGRKPNIDGLGLENTGINFDSKGIKVDDNMLTNIRGVYAIGDVNGRAMLAHAATAQGIRSVNHILKKSDNIRMEIMPAAVFTNPEVAGVGLTSDQCDAMGIEYNTRKGFYRSNGKALAMDESEGMVKLITDNNNKIIGCHAYGAHAADIIQEATVIMNFDGTTDNLRDIIHTHPTLEEILHDSTV